jgi:hypothetical protein
VTKGIDSIFERRQLFLHVEFHGDGVFGIHVIYLTSLVQDLDSQLLVALITASLGPLGGNRI